MKKILLSLVACALMFCAVSAKAEIITDWTISANAYFTGITSSNTNWYESQHNAALNPIGYHWGTPVGDQESGAALTPAVGGTVVTDGAAVVAAAFTHINYPVTDYGVSALQFAVDVTLTAANDVSIVKNLNLSLNLGFWETPNESGDNLDNDIFYFVGGLTERTETFTVGDDIYDIFLTVDFNELAGAYLEKLQNHLGAPGQEYYGWTTVERDSTTVPFMISVRHDTIPADTPEPATLAVLGLGLIGLPFARRFRNK